MITLNDYLYKGDTIFKILQRYTDDLEHEATCSDNEIDHLHVEFLNIISDLLEHNEFLTMQANRIREFYKYMAAEYPYLAFTFKGRIKSIIRAEEKFNGYIVEFIYDYYKEHKCYPTIEEIKERLTCFRDLLAYRIVISMPQCHIKEGQDRTEIERRYLYEIANKMPGFLQNQGFSIIKDTLEGKKISELMDPSLSGCYRDYVENPNKFGYQSLHITFYDDIAHCYIELQLRTKTMDDHAEIGAANHLAYEKRQEFNRARRQAIPLGECRYFDDAYERVMKLQNLELSEIDVNMFTAYSNTLINDGCGLFRGRQIQPFEHLSRFQNDLID